ncbi:PLDc N-terminal domain-containing protein [Leucobacter sp. CSA1]|uniref:PLDc N-terminal domain-containing protein n=1 Tax=Leucobacter chromiisoli TaxID=2796471 RepID=A0A934Q858_9MICO|nr:PLDc N-terminal domain-containing protein [Leucobacter chromiisoli]MBK0418876.1 PLDc N-terminal domain-containing protein [Leucobacter chromiisoli]
MVRFVIIGIVIAVAFTLYSLVDAAMTDGERARGVSKPVWVILVVVLPVIGGILWFTIGKGEVPPPPAKAPDDDPRFSGTKMSSIELDEHVRELEERLRELDEEVFPGETGEPGPGRASAQGDAGAATDPRAGAGEDDGSGSGPDARSGSGPDHGGSGSDRNARPGAGASGGGPEGDDPAVDDADPGSDAPDPGTRREGGSELGDPRTDRS